MMRTCSRHAAAAMRVEIGHRLPIGIGGLISRRMAAQAFRARSLRSRRVSVEMAVSHEQKSYPVKIKIL